MGTKIQFPEDEFNMEGLAHFPNGNIEDGQEDEVEVLADQGVNNEPM